MNYGHFDLANKEYVITNPETPAPWANYLGSPEYGAIISNNAGGYSFVKSGANGRVIRYRFNSVALDQMNVMKQLYAFQTFTILLKSASGVFTWRLPSFSCQ